MKHDDVELIRRTLSGDDTAFSELVKKYQKPVQSLVWRKIGDFHIAEEITQDIFLIVYQRLHSLRDPRHFAGWIYVIATRQCYAWLRKKRIKTQPLEDVETPMRKEDAYSRHVAEDRHKTTVEAQREVVKRLLAKLKESERTVMTLHYLGDMTIEEISKFIGVSAGTIKSRLQRARNRLQKEETMIREALDHFQISPNLTENIMQEVSRLNLLPTGSKPLMPWAVAASSLVLITLMLGIGSQFLAQFQKPYSLDTQAEMTVELVDAPISLNLDVKDATRQLGNADVVGKSNNSRQKQDEIFFPASQDQGEDDNVKKQQWIQSNPLAGSSTNSLLATPEGDLYSIVKGEIYKLPANQDTWTHVFDIFTLPHTSVGQQFPLKKWDNTLYYTQSSEFYNSVDDGKTWNLLYSWDEEFLNSIGLVLTEKSFYMAFSNAVFRSNDIGKTWEKIDDGLPEINSLVNIEDTVFVGTFDGLYRYNEGRWKRMEFPIPVEWVFSVTVADDRIYALGELNYTHPGKVSRGLERGWGIFRSSDLGSSWEDITPTDAWAMKGFVPEAKLLAVGETLLVMEKGMIRSTDGGNTWLHPQLPRTTPEMNSNAVAAVVNKHIIYIGSFEGLHRSTDGGKSWDKINIGSDESGIDEIITIKKLDRPRNTQQTLYARLGSSLVRTTDKGKSWEDVQYDIPMSKPHREEQPSITHILNYGGEIYVKGGDYPPLNRDSSGRLKTLLYRVSTDDNILVPMQGMPVLDSSILVDLLSAAQLFDGPNNPLTLQDSPLVKKLNEKPVGATAFIEKLDQFNPLRPNDFSYLQLGFNTGPFAISDDTFYMEYNYKLFRWETGDAEWYDTGLEETVELAVDIARKDLKLAVSGDTVYVGKRDGHLTVSYDKGKNWIDLTSAVPFKIKTFKDIVVAESAVYVATDAGIISSDGGRHWQVITDARGTNITMERLTVDGKTLYGVTGNKGVYRLENGTWEQIVSEIPNKVTSFAVDGNTVYIGTESSGMLYYVFESNQ